KFEGGGAGAVPLARQRGDGRADDLAGVGGVLVEDGDDLIHGHIVVTFAPAVVVGNHGDGGVADFRFAGELGFLKVGHADNVGSPASVKVGLGACGELRTFHADVGSAGFAYDAFASTAVSDGAGDAGADGVSESHVSDQAFAEKRGDTAGGSIDELVGDEEVGGLVLFLEGTDGGNRKNALDAELLHGIDVGTEVQLRGEDAVAARVTSEEGD